MNDVKNLHVYVHSAILCYLAITESVDNMIRINESLYPSIDDSALEMFKRR